MKVEAQVDAIHAIAQHIAQMQGRVIVAIDGVDGAGKTTFADMLALKIEAIGKPVIKASIDGFHKPRARRYQRGNSDPLGYFLDSYNYTAFQDYLIAPFRKGAASVHLVRFDHRRDQENLVTALVPQDAALLIDGIFLHRDELRSQWDYSVFLHAPFEVTFKRMARRDGLDPNPFAASNARYLQGQQIYLECCEPSRRASVTIDWQMLSGQTDISA
jgi:uridine kinase